MNEPVPITKRDTATGNGTADREPQETVNASARGGTRARITGNPAITSRDGVTRIMAMFTPPDIWAERRPCLRELWLYARHGDHAGATGFARGWARVWAVLVTFPMAVAAYYLSWIAERPARFFAALLLYVVIVHTGIGGWLPWPSWLP